MMSWCVMALSLGIALALESGRREDGSHSYTYHVQPALRPGSNPYRDGYLKLECVASGPPMARFSLEWRHRSASGEVVKLKGGTRNSNANNQSSRIVFDRLLPDLSRVGDYWCVIVDDDGKELSPSRSAVLLPPKGYVDGTFEHPVTNGTITWQSGTVAAIKHHRREASSTQASQQTNNNGDSLKVSLYVILAVVVVFCGVIVVLTISVVILCHRKCKVFAINGDLRTRSEHRSNTNGHEIGSAPHSSQSNMCSRCERPPVQAATEVAPPPQKPDIPATSAANPHLAVSEYSKLAEWNGSMATTAPSPSLAGSPPVPCPGPHTIYSMDNSSDGYNSRAHYYHMLEQQLGRDSLTSSVSGKSDPSDRTQVRTLLSAEVVVGQRDGSTSHCLREGGMEPVDPRYLGDYERHPDYIPKPPQLPPKASQGSADVPPVPPHRRQSLNHNQRVGLIARPSDTLDPTHPGDYEVDPKYQGDYERDPHYVLPLCTTKSSPSTDDDKYQGDYERDPNYVPSHSFEVRRANPSGHYYRERETDVDSEDMWDSKYGGDYERDPDYMRNKLMFSPQGSTGPNHNHPYAQTNTLSEGSPAATMYHHNNYKALDSTRREPLRPYTQLSIDQTTNCSLSSTNSEFT